MNNMNKISPNIDKQENDPLRILENMDESQKAALHDFVVRHRRLIEGMMFTKNVDLKEHNSDILHDNP